MSSDIEQQYESYPYPSRDPKSDLQITTLTNDLCMIGHYAYGGVNWYSNECRVLVAGGGTGDATLHLAQQLSDLNPDAEIVHLDLSSASIELTRARLDHMNLNNVELIKGSLLDLPKGEYGSFDYINCSGVLHHLKDPDEGARALVSSLKDQGAMSIMLYGTYGRRIIYDIQKLAKLVCPANEDLSARIPIVRQIIEQLPEHNPLKYIFSLDMTDNELVDRYLHIQDRSYTAPQVLDFLDKADLQLISFIPSGAYDANLVAGQGELRSRVNSLSEKQRLEFVEILHGSMDRHIFFAAKKGLKLAKFPDPTDLKHVPILVSSGLIIKAKADPVGVTFSEPVVDKFGPMHMKLIDHIDGKMSIGEIITRMDEEMAAGKAELLELWLDVYNILNIRGYIVLKKPE